MPTFKLGVLMLFALLMGAAYQLGHPLAAIIAGIGVGIVIGDPSRWSADE